MSCQRIVLLTCVCHLFSTLLFMYGYFPNKTSNSYGFASPGNVPNSEPGATSTNTFYRRMVGKTVIVVIDALRADFVFDHYNTNAMPYLQSLLTNKQAVGVVARAQPPTVTLPRIKAMTTGTIPGYIDVVMNFGASQLNEDHLLYQAQRKGLKTVFYGDDTWIRLFPTHFLRREGTTSFFVTDFKEVDDNVTRHLSPELKRDDWDLLILHYLGLDHIGHVHGLRNSLIISKLKEMDDIVKQIHTTLLAQTSNSSLPPLVVICGDHGMNDAGSHGGSSTTETHIPLIFTMPLPETELKNTPKFGKAFQVDITASLSVLLGLPIPINNIGKIVPAVLSSLDWRQRLYLTYVNAQQLYQVAQRHSFSRLDDSCLGFHRAKEEHRKWLSKNCSVANVQCEEDAVDILKSYYNVMSSMGSSITSRAISYDHYAMLIAVIIQWLTLFVTVLAVAGQMTSSSSTFSSKCSWTIVIVLATFIVCDYLKIFGESALFDLRIESISTLLLSALLLTLSLNELWVVFQQNRRFRSQRQRVIRWPTEWLKEGRYVYMLMWFVVALLLHSLSLASSSYVEEEHYTWYYLTTSTILILLYTIGHNWAVERSRFEKGAVRSQVDYSKRILTLLLFRLGRNWNSTGDHWIHLEDIGDWLNGAGNQSWLLLSISVGLCLLVGVRVQYHHRWSVKVLLVLMACLLWLYKAKMQHLLPSMFSSLEVIPSNHIARFILVLNAVVCVSGFLEKKRLSKVSCFLNGVNTFWLFMAALLSRPHNISWLSLVALQDYLLTHNLHLKELSVENIILLRLFLAKSTFFQQGNSNNLARIDLVGGYVGLDTYHPVVIGILLTCSTYSSAIFWLTSLSSHIYNLEPHRFYKNLLKASQVLLTTQVLIWSFYTVFAFILRYHLFVWTVFSPKLLFEGAFSVIILFVIAYFQLLQFI